MNGPRRLRLGLIGRGRMGRLVREVALERGHEIGLEQDSREIHPAEALSRLDLAIEFTSPEAAPQNLRRCLEAGTSVVSGTTGWADPERVRALAELAERRGAGLLIAANFAFGVLLLRRLVQQAAQSLADHEDFDLWVEESHHRGKRDWPSGTALALAEDVLEHLPRKSALRRGLPDGPARPEELLVSSSRGGFEPGLHRIVIDAQDETLELVHRARSRRVFATGAVRAAEWLAGRTGLHSLTEMFDSQEERK